MVAESGWSEDLTDLIQDARLPLIGSELRTRVVIIVAFTEMEKPAAGKQDLRLELDLVSGQRSGEETTKTQPERRNHSTPWHDQGNVSCLPS